MREKPDSGTHAPETSADELYRKRGWKPQDPDKKPRYELTLVLPDASWHVIAEGLGPNFILIDPRRGWPGPLDEGPDKLTLKYDCPRQEWELETLSGQRVLITRDALTAVLWTELSVSSQGILAHPVTTISSEITGQGPATLAIRPNWWEDWFTQDKTIEDLVALGPEGFRCDIPPRKVPRIKVALHAERQRFAPGKDRLPTPNQLSRQGVAVADQGHWRLPEKLGLDLTVSEDRALAAIQKLCAKRNYVSDGPPLAASFRTKHTPSLNSPVLIFPLTEYLDAFGVAKFHSRRGKLEYSGAERERAVKALREMGEKRHLLVWERKHWKDGRRASDLITSNNSVWQVFWGYKDLAEEEVEKVIAGEHGAAEPVYVRLQLHPILLDGIQNFFMLRDPELHQQIRALKGGKYRMVIPNFIYWSQTWDRPHVEIGTLKLAQRLRLQSLIKTRHPGRIYRQLEEAYDVAYRLGYLDSCRRKQGRQGNDVEVFFLTDKALRGKGPTALLPEGRDNKQ